jgi:hypothetical protein
MVPDLQFRGLSRVRFSLLARVAKRERSLQPLTICTIVHIIGRVQLLNSSVEWDANNESHFLKKHGVSFTEAVTALMDEFAIAIEDDLPGESDPNHLSTKGDGSGKHDV